MGLVSHGMILCWKLFHRFSKITLLLMSKQREKRVEHGGWPHGLKFQPLKTNIFSLWAPKSFINQIAKNTSSSPAFPNLW